MFRKRQAHMQDIAMTGKEPEKTVSISVVVPLYNEAENAAELHREILHTLETHYQDYEIIFVNDGSRDRTDEVCRNLRPLRYISLRRNFGQTAAMDAGIKAARGEYIITMDGDRQNDPADIPKMMEYLISNDLDVVSGWRKERKDPAEKRIVSKGANLLRKLLVHDGIHDSGCSLKVYRRECFRNLTIYGEQHRFIPAILEIRGFRVGEIPVHHRERTAGKSKYNWKRVIKGFVDMISVWFWHKYASRPLHLLGALGLLFLAGGFGFGIWSVILFAMGKDMTSYIIVPLLTVFFVIIGLLMFVFGLMGETMMKIYYEGRSEVPYYIRETVENK